MDRRHQLGSVSNGASSAPGSRTCEGLIWVGYGGRSGFRSLSTHNVWVSTLLGFDVRLPPHRQGGLVPHRSALLHRRKPVTRRMKTEEGGWVSYNRRSACYGILPSQIFWGPLSEWSTASDAEHRPTGRIKVMPRHPAGFVDSVHLGQGVMPS